MSSDAVIRIMCPNLTCKRILAVPTTARGKLVRCRGCGINLRIPQGKLVDPAPVSTSEATGKPAAQAKSGPTSNTKAA